LLCGLSQKHFAKRVPIESDAAFRHRIVAAVGCAIAMSVRGAELDEIGEAHGVKRIGAGETPPGTVLSARAGMNRRCSRSAGRRGRVLRRRGITARWWQGQRVWHLQIRVIYRDLQVPRLAFAVR
jgi:hypothetical protein